MAAVKQNANCHTPLHSFDMYILLPCFIFFSLKNPESEETKQSQRAVRLFRLLNLFCCYFFFFFDGPNTVYCISTQKHLLCLLESSFLLVFFLGSTTEFIIVTAFLLLSLLFVSSEICIFFTLKPIIKHASLITPSSSHTTNTCTFRDFRVLQKNKKQKKKF